MDIPRKSLPSVPTGVEQSPLFLVGSRGFVTMRLAVALIREVWLWELRTYGSSKDIEQFRLGGLGMLQCEEAIALMGN